MGIVHTEITLKNVKDEAIAPETVTAVVDTGSLNLVITEDLRRKLGLGIDGERTAHIANGQRITCKMTDAVKVYWKDRATIVQAMVIPGAEKVLLGAIPLEAMDLMVSPAAQEVVGIHGDKIEYLAL